MFKIQPSIKILLAISLLLVGFVLYIIFSLFSHSRPAQQTTLIIRTTPKAAQLSIPQYNIAQKSPVTIPNLRVGTRVTIGAFTSGHEPTQQIITVTDSPEQQITISLTPLKDPALLDELDKGLKGDVNPKYVELLKTQPFWDMLPHYGSTFLVEYKQSNKIIQITTIIPPDGPSKNSLIQKYRQEALDWLKSNGAQLESLRITFIPNTP